MIHIADIERAAETIRSYIIRTPLVYSPTLSRMTGARIHLKLENLQKTGSFKTRGAVNKLITAHKAGVLSAKGVVAASAGNHAQGVAVAARAMGLPATIVMPCWASITKQEATRNYGAQVIIHGKTLEESLTKARELCNQGLTFIHPFDDKDIIAGQATVGLEILNDLPDVDTIVTPVGGGGLIAGIALAATARKPGIRIIGVQAAACPSVRAAMEAGRRVKVHATPSIADGISVKQIGRLPFRIIRQKVAKVITVEESQIAAAILLLLERKKVLAEGAGAAAMAALLSGALETRRDENIVLVISGGNVDSPLLGRIVHQGLVNNGRIVRIGVRIADRPGVLAGVLQLLAALDANVLHIHHNRDEGRAPIDEAHVELTLETRSHEHIREVLQAMERSGVEILHSGRPRT